MKKKIANGIQLILLIVSFILLNLPTITRVTDASAFATYTTSVFGCIERYPIMLVPMCVLYILSAVMCIISIVSKSTYKDGKAHGAVAILLFIVSVYNIIACTSDEMIIDSKDFPGVVFIGLLFAVIVVAFAKRSSFIAESKESQQTVVNNIQETTNADELKKYKDLLDSGAITQEEFENKKKELLGL